MVLVLQVERRRKGSVFLLGHMSWTRSVWMMVGDNERLEGNVGMHGGDLWGREGNDLHI